jgi:hypothetical protein
MAGYRAEQPVPLAVNSVGEVECVGTAIIAADPEINRPKAARATAAGVDWERSVELPIGRVEGVDFAMKKAEVADQQMITEPGETGWGENNPPKAPRGGCLRPVP